MHDVTDECARIHCEFHHEDEPGPGYLACGECFHLFPTKRSLRRCHRKVTIEMWLWAGSSNPWRQRRLRFWWKMLTLRAGRIYSCPFCAHDF